MESGDLNKGRALRAHKGVLHLSVSDQKTRLEEKFDATAQRIQMTKDAKARDSRNYRPARAVSDKPESTSSPTCGLL